MSIFNKKLGSLETISKYLIEKEKKKKSEVAELLNRDVKTIGASYSKAQQKMPAKFRISDSDRSSASILLT